MSLGVERPDTSLRVRVPGGATIGPGVSGSNPRRFELAMSMLQQINSVVAPLRPFLDLIRFAASVVRFVEALGDVIKIPPDLSKLRQATAELAQTSSALLAINPTTAFVPFMADLVSMSRILLLGMEEKLAEVEAIQVGAEGIRAAAEGVSVAAQTAMLSDADSLTQVANDVASSVSDVLGPISTLFLSVNSIAESLRVPTRIPVIAQFEGVQEFRAAVEQFRAALSVLP